MARHAFFSFHYQNDVWRSNVVRNCNALDVGVDTTFFDGVEREEVKSNSREEIKSWIDEQLQQTSVTAIIIGEKTADRDFIQYEVKRSIERGNGVVGVRVHDIPDENGETSPKGPNPLDEFVIERDGEWVQVSDIFETYQFSQDNGQERLGEWLEEGAKIANRLADEEQGSIHHIDSVTELPDTDKVRSGYGNSINQGSGDFFKIAGMGVALAVGKVIYKMWQGKSLEQSMNELRDEVLQAINEALPEETPEGDDPDPWNIN